VTDESSPAASEVWLDEFLTSVGQSITAARAALRHQHIADLQDHWRDQGADGLQAEVVRLAIGSADDKNTIPAATFVVPTAALVQHNSLALETVSMEVECTLVRHSTTSEGESRIGIRLTRAEDAESPVKISLQYKLTAVPEGVARLSEIALRRIS
jgi:Protein of unknown function (DUF2589)